MATSAKDVFSQADSFGLGDGWTLLYGAPEIVDHAVVISVGSPQFSELIALYSTGMDSDEHRVGARITFGTGATHAIQLYARAETVLVAGEDVLNKAYYMELTPTLLSLYSLITSEATPLLLASVAVELQDIESHVVSMKVREQATGAQLDVFVDNDVCPVLSYTDQKNKRPGGLHTGFGLVDDASQDVSLTEFLSYVLRSSSIKPVRPPVRLLTFGDLIHQASFRLDRSGNSQFPADEMGNYINFAIDEIYNELTPWSWAFRSMSFVVPQGTRYVELPPYVSLLYDVINSTLGYSLQKITSQQLNRANPLNNSTGSSHAFTVMGMGDFGGLVLEVNPIPAADAVFVIQYYAKSIPMEEDNEIPLIPTQWLELVIHGALKRGAQYDTDQRLYQNVNGAWERMMNRMKRQHYTDMKFKPRFTTTNEIAHKTYMGGPVTRAEQLGV